jgi:hypothetical protein
MTSKTIKYSQRLGDVLRCLPAAKYLADKGHEVFIDCFAQYHGVFEMTSYVKAGHRQGDIIDLEIWPNKYEAFIKSRKPWHDFVYSHPEIKGADKTNIILDKLEATRIQGLPENYNLVAPFGISQTDKRNPIEIIVEARKQMGEKNFYVLCPEGLRINGLNCYTARTISDMAKVIRDADGFWTINSSPVILASAVRKGKETIFYPERGESEIQNVWRFDGLVRAD